MSPLGYYQGFNKEVKIKRAFLCFHLDDLRQVRELRPLLSNPNYELDFYDESIETAIDSSDSTHIKRVIGNQISRASVTVCLIGESTHASKWVDWELERSDEEGNAIIAMAFEGIDKTILPKFIESHKIEFRTWNPSHLATLIGEIRDGFEIRHKGVPERSRQPTRLTDSNKT
ncbi:TIR domain-containing protein [Candidatus Omnitrophota bacterium]